MFSENKRVLLRVNIHVQYINNEFLKNNLSDGSLEQTKNERIDT